MSQKNKLITIILIGYFNVCFGQTMFNNYNISKDKHNITINGSFGNTVLGMGVNLNDKDFPIKSTERLVQISNIVLKENEAQIKNVTPIKPENVSFVVNTTEIVNTEELSTYLSTSLKGSYGVTSGSMSYSKSKQLTKEYHNKIIELTYTTSQPDISNFDFDLNQININQNLTSEEKQRAFLNKYGSHFISDIKYGFRISIIGSLSKKNSSEIEMFKAAMSGAFSGASASGTITSSQKIFLSSKKVNIRAEVTAGGISTNQYLLNSFEEIERFINEFKEGNIQIYPGPLSFSASTYWTYLDDYPDLQKFFSTNKINKLQANNGVPSGTVIPFKVPTNFNGQIEEIIPDGWKLFSELTDRFIMGTSDLDEVGEMGGTTKHSHEAHGVNYDLAPDASHKGDGAKIDDSNHLPPYYKLIFIIKL